MGRDDVKADRWGGRWRVHDEVIGRCGCGRASEILPAYGECRQPDRRQPGRAARRRADGAPPRRVTVKGSGTTAMRVPRPPGAGGAEAERAGVNAEAESQEDRDDAQTARSPRAAGTSRALRPCPTACRRMGHHAIVAFKEQPTPHKSRRRAGRGVRPLERSPRSRLRPEVPSRAPSLAVRLRGAHPN
jgi:hypothetical protein